MRRATTFASALLPAALLLAAMAGPAGAGPHGGGGGGGHFAGGGGGGPHGGGYAPHGGGGPAVGGAPPPHVAGQPVYRGAPPPGWHGGWYPHGGYYAHGYYPHNRVFIVPGGPGVFFGGGWPYYGYGGIPTTTRTRIRTRTTGIRPRIRLLPGTRASSTRASSILPISNTLPTRERRRLPVPARRRLPTSPRARLLRPPDPPTATSSSIASRRMPPSTSTDASGWTRASSTSAGCPSRRVCTPSRFACGTARRSIGGSTCLPGHRR